MWGLLLSEFQNCIRMLLLPCNNEKKLVRQFLTRNYKSIKIWGVGFLYKPDFSTVSVVPFEVGDVL